MSELCKGCKGCILYDGLEYICVVKPSYKDIECPCKTCLIKGVCHESCEKFIEYGKNFK